MHGSWFCRCKQGCWQHMKWNIVSKINLWSQIGPLAWTNSELVMKYKVPLDEVPIGGREVHSNRRQHRNQGHIRMWGCGFAWARMTTLIGKLYTWEQPCFDITQTFVDKKFERLLTTHVPGSNLSDRSSRDIPSWWFTAHTPLPPTTESRCKVTTVFASYWKVHATLVILIQSCRDSSPCRIRDSAVGIASGYGLDNREVGVRVPVQAKIFSFACSPDWFLDPPSLRNGDSFPGGKAAEL
jgi:hypothetical protein